MAAMRQLQALLCAETTQTSDEERQIAVQASAGATAAQPAWEVLTVQEQALPGLPRAHLPAQSGRPHQDDTMATQQQPPPQPPQQQAFARHGGSTAAHEHEQQRQWRLAPVRRDVHTACLRQQAWQLGGGQAPGSPRWLERDGRVECAQRAKVHQQQPQGPRAAESIWRAEQCQTGAPLHRVQQQGGLPPLPGDAPGGAHRVAAAHAQLAAGPASMSYGGEAAPQPTATAGALLRMAMPGQIARRSDGAGVAGCTLPAVVTGEDRAEAGRIPRCCAGQPPCCGGGGGAGSWPWPAGTLLAIDQEAWKEVVRAAERGAQALETAAAPCLQAGAVQLGDAPAAALHAQVLANEMLGGL